MSVLLHWSDPSKHDERILNQRRVSMLCPWIVSNFSIWTVQKMVHKKKAITILAESRSHLLFFQWPPSLELYSMSARDLWNGACGGHTYYWYDWHEALIPQLLCRLCLVPWLIVMIFGVLILMLLLGVALVCFRYPIMVLFGFGLSLGFKALFVVVFLWDGASYLGSHQCFLYKNFVHWCNKVECCGDDNGHRRAKCSLSYSNAHTY